jgi:hypothetical protein
MASCGPDTVLECWNDLDTRLDQGSAFDIRNWPRLAIMGALSNRSPTSASIPDDVFQENKIILEEVYGELDKCSFFQQAF